MIKRSTFRFFIFSILLSSLAFTSQAQQDSVLLKEDTFYEWVLNYHPIAKKANNMLEMGEQSLVQARGGFDPYLSSKNKQKFYKNTNYYLISNSSLEIPTRFGVSFNAGYDWNDGTYINPENNLPDNGLWYAGISVPVLNGLIIDEARANFQKARVDKRNFENERIKLLNSLLVESAQYYWKWRQFYWQQKVIEDAIRFARTNFNNYKTAYEQGDKPAIDTLEANIQLQNLAIQLQQVNNDLNNARLSLETFLWGEQSNQVDSAFKAPATVEAITAFTVDSLQQNTNFYIQEHPEIRTYDLKLQSLNIDTRLKREKLKPKLNVEYNLLQDPANNLSEVQGLDNYKWGLSFSFPLFLRSERGALKLNQLKAENTNYEFQQKKLSVRNKAEQYENTFLNTQKQLETYERVVEQYQALLDAEIQKFDIGESSIFLINYRQMSLVNARLKYLELQSKYRYYYRQWLYSLGIDPSDWLKY